MIENIMKNHIRSMASSRSIVMNWVDKWISTYGEQEIYHVEQIHIGGKYNHYTGIYQGAEQKYLLIEIVTAKDLKSWDEGRYEIIDDIKVWEEEKGIDIKSMNHQYVLDNRKKWLVKIDDIEKKVLGMKPVIRPLQVDDNREGYYGVYHEFGKLLYIVEMTSENMFSFFDKVRGYATNFSFAEMVENGYLSVESHMSWLGQNGKNVHAVESYFRVIEDEIIYFSLQTWCSGNHWRSYEHSPIAKYPNEKEVTCKKCLRKMEKKNKMESAN
jgi:hypothetical protein